MWLKIFIVGPKIILYIFFQCGWFLFTLWTIVIKILLLFNYFYMKNGLIFDNLIKITVFFKIIITKDYYSYPF